MNNLNSTDGTTLSPRVLEIAMAAAKRHGWTLEFGKMSPEPEAWILRLMSNDDMRDGEWVEVFYEDQWLVTWQSANQDDMGTAEDARKIGRWLSAGADLADELTALTSGALSIVR